MSSILPLNAIRRRGADECLALETLGIALYLMYARNHPQDGRQRQWKCLQSFSQKAVPDTPGNELNMAVTFCPLIATIAIMACRARPEISWRPGQESNDDLGRRNTWNWSPRQRHLGTKHENHTRIYLFSTPPTTCSPVLAWHSLAGRNPSEFCFAMLILSQKIAIIPQQIHSRGLPRTSRPHRKVGQQEHSHIGSYI